MSDDRSESDEVGPVLRRGLKAALARWVLTKRRGPSAPPPTPQDEATHAWDGQRYFAESYTFVGAQAGMGVVVRLEWLPGRDCQRVWVVLLRPDGVWALPGGQLVSRCDGDDRWRAGGLHLDCETPLQRWTLRFVGMLERQGHGRDTPALHVVGPGDHRVRASLDLTFVATMQPHVPGTDDDPELLARCLGHASWDARLLQAARRGRPRGYVQIGELHGTVALGDALVPVRAAALREHQWGVRDWGACDEAFQCFWATDDRHSGWLHHARFPFVTLEGGFGLPRSGRAEPLRRLGATLESRPRRAPAQVSISLGEAVGTRALELEMISDLSFVVDGRGRVDLALVRVGGAASGWGIWAGLRRTLPRVDRSNA